MNIAKLKTRAEGLVTQLTTTDECEKRVYDALSNRSYAAHPSLLNEIAEDTFQFDRYGTADQGFSSSCRYTSVSVHIMLLCKELVKVVENSRGSGSTPKESDYPQVVRTRPAFQTSNFAHAGWVLTRISHALRIIGRRTHPKIHMVRIICGQACTYRTACTGQLKTNMCS